MIFVDTGAFLARYYKRDQYHESAASHWKSIQNNHRECFTSNLVVDEFLTLLGRRTNYRLAAKIGRTIYASTFFRILRPDEFDELQALDLFQQYADQRISFTDCVSFALMNKHNLTKVFSFDHHFRIAGFEVEP